MAELTQGHLQPPAAESPELPSGLATRHFQVPWDNLVPPNMYIFICMCIYRLPRWLRGKESTRQCKRCRFNPWVGKNLWRRKWQPTPVFLLREFHGQRSLVGYRPWGRKESDTTEQLSTCTHVLRRAKGTHWADILETLSIICSQNQPDQEAPSPEPGCLSLRPTESMWVPCVLPLSSWSCLANSCSHWFHLSVCVCVCVCVYVCALSRWIQIKYMYSSGKRG